MEMLIAGIMYLLTVVVTIAVIHRQLRRMRDGIVSQIVERTRTELTAEVQARIDGTLKTANPVAAIESVVQKAKDCLTGGRPQTQMPSEEPRPTVTSIGTDLINWVLPRRQTQ